MASSLDAHLGSECGDDPLKQEVAETIRNLCGAAIKLRNTIAAGGEGLGQAHGGTNADGDIQKELDVVADKVFIKAAKASPLAFFGSEEQESAVRLKPDARLAMAIDPLDGSSNISTNVSIGTIFSILPVEEAHRANPDIVFTQKGSRQLGAGFFIYGPQLLLVMSMGNGTHVFIFSPSFGGFIELSSSIVIVDKAKEFAINASNYRHWDQPIRSYVDDLLAGSEGPRERDFNMRWVGSLVADCYRILSRGGVFLYPGDGRKGYAKGRLRLMYEANPIAFCVEHAGGKATDGTTPILDLEPKGLHDRTPLVFGSKREVERVARYIADPSALAERSPLFGKRSLFRA
ncbi:class 1 fructose-bisphosphatase [Jiella sp. MQZ9-1]|uniref:Fructose-1,6-bisphosphatase class 1 n=1 Tax=Jiella flava TaxID=2816857 RepID=A0A939JX40_9HYPH|nr:class 1 fructose-bisphosphatase [Jiella flava]MBO0663667.1 class 1 fructose-bisphosphatase [Jiella flava]MCD2472240.1 class 1 fructose-bisphosphatase [Jiella flava]